MSAKPKRKRREARGKFTPERAGRVIQNLLDHLFDSVVLVEMLAERLNQPKPKDPPAAVAILTTLRHLLPYYLDLARRGHPALISELPLYARQMVEALDELAVAHPELMARTAEREIEWSIMAARNYYSRYIRGRY